ncbi:MAG: GIY-YIG nuclease family protein [Candidatus Omnitrophica bacterium]|nr:GIY-YIG nuclease family protein [Candidatus Omnitrophota bacterium]
MEYVYILKSKKDNSKQYVGITSDLKRRLNQHNNARSNHYTYKYAPWEIETYIAFRSKNLAKEFEAYLKSHSGRAFLRRRLIVE